MKPTLQFADKTRRELSDREVRRGSAHPKTDCNFQSALVANGKGSCFGRPSFRAISGEYFKDEARGHFVGEAALFIVIAVIAALPIINNLSELTHLVRSFAAF